MVARAENKSLNSVIESAVTQALELNLTEIDGETPQPIPLPSYGESPDPTPTYTGDPAPIPTHMDATPVRGGLPSGTDAAAETPASLDNIRISDLNAAIEENNIDPGVVLNADMTTLALTPGDTGGTGSDAGSPLAVGDTPSTGTRAIC